MLDEFDGNVELALAGYNGGPYRIRRLWKEAGPDAELDDFVENLALDESRDYVKRILVLSDSYRQLYPELAGGVPRRSLRWASRPRRGRVSNGQPLRAARRIFAKILRASRRIVAGQVGRSGQRFCR